MAILKRNINGKTYVHISAKGEFHDKLTQGIYTIKFDNNEEEFFLEEQPPFALPPKLYGDFSIIERWRLAWENSRKNMGILLGGLKGSGKTITAQKFCIDMGMPVMIINQTYNGAQLAILQEFFGRPELQNSIVMIDEFEKLYGTSSYDDYDDRQSSESNPTLLSMFDGPLQTRMIFLLTVNDLSVIDDKMVNRLNRIRYFKNYESLDSSVIDEVIDDMLINKSHRESLYNLLDKIGMVTFDLLVGIIKDMNLFNEDATSVGKHLYLSNSNTKYTIFEIFSDNPNDVHYFDADYITLNNSENFLLTKDGRDRMTLRLMSGYKDLGLITDPDDLEKLDKLIEDADGSKYQSIYGADNKNAYEHLLKKYATVNLKTAKRTRLSGGSLLFEFENNRKALFMPTNRVNPFLDDPMVIATNLYQEYLNNKKS